jgi:hypothetical protein
MEISVGKSVDGEYVAIFGFQPLAEFQQVLPVGKLVCGIRSEAQADSVGFVGAYGLAYAQDVVFKGGEGFRPVSPAMNVGAISEVYAVSEAHA